MSHYFFYKKKRFYSDIIERKNEELVEYTCFFHNCVNCFRNVTLSGKSKKILPQIFHNDLPRSRFDDPALRYIRTHYGSVYTSACVCVVNGWKKSYLHERGWQLALCLPIRISKPRVYLR